MTEEGTTPFLSSGLSKRSPDGAQRNPGFGDPTFQAFVMPALVAGIHVFLACVKPKTWMAGTSPAMTAGYARLKFTVHGVCSTQPDGADMSKPVIFTISAAWDDEASVWSGHCDDIPAAADAPTLDEVLAKISAMALDLLPDNHPGIDPQDLFLQITALREAEPATA